MILCSNSGVPIIFWSICTFVSGCCTILLFVWSLDFLKSGSFWSIFKVGNRGHFVQYTANTVGEESVASFALSKIPLCWKISLLLSVGQILPRLVILIPWVNHLRDKHLCHSFISHYSSVLMNEIDFSVDIVNMQLIHVFIFLGS